MKGSRALPVTTASALKELMTLILSVAYPQVFDCGNKVLIAAAELEQSDHTRLLKSYMDGIYNAAERLFYKEKIVLFPYLEKQFTPEGKLKAIPAVTTSIEAGMRASKMIQSFETEILAAVPDASDVAMKTALFAAYRELEQSWASLCRQRLQLFDCFVPGSTTKV